MQNSFSHLPPSLTAHLADSSSNTILTTHPSPSSSGLSTLSSAFIHAHESASRMGLGVPVRISVATKKDLIVLQTGAISDEQKPSVNGEAEEAETQPDVSQEGQMLVGTIVGTGSEMAEARVTSWTTDDVAKRLLVRMKK